METISRILKIQFLLIVLLVLLVLHSEAQNTYPFPQNAAVGIGTTTPQAQTKLHIHGGVVRLSGNTSWGGPMITFGGTPGSGPAQHGQWGIEYDPSAHGLNFWRPMDATNATGDITGYQMTNFVLFLSDNNRIGIKTNNPNADFTVNGKAVIGSPTMVTMPGDYKLFVQGGILTERVKVAIVGSTAWSDYVFDEDYELRPLEDLEAFVKAYKHLPDVPSACEVEEEGLNLAEMDATLLRKIEELTLHVIDQNKRIHALEEELRAANSQTRE
jgi:hypothetical protein